MTPTRAAPIPAPGSHTHIGRPWPHVRARRLAAEVHRRVGADSHEERVTERHLSGDAGEQVEPESGDGEDHGLTS